MKKLLALIAFSGFISLPAFACSCADLPTADQILKEEGMAFLGVPSTSKQMTRGEFPLMKTRFTVVRGFKGVSTKFLEIWSEKDDGANCGVNFKGDEGVYLVTTYKDGSRVYTSSCEIHSLSYEDTELTALIRELSARTK